MGNRGSELVDSVIWEIILRNWGRLTKGEIKYVKPQGKSGSKRMTDSGGRQFH